MPAFFEVFTLASIGLPATNGFIGEFLILLGGFTANKLAGILASTGIIIGAWYMLWLYQRVFFMDINQKVIGLPDMDVRESLTLIPMLLLVFWIGVYPNSFLGLCTYRAALRKGEHRRHAGGECSKNDYGGSQMNFQFPDLTPMMPELVMTALALAVLLLDLVIKKKEVLALISMAGVAFASLTLFAPPGVTFGTMYIADGYSTFFKMIFFVNVILTVLISIKYIAVERVNYGEYYSLILFSTIGMMIMASAGDLIVLYLGLELMALSTYVLAGFIRHDMKSNEAALKYFLLGAFSSHFCSGISLIYGLMAD
jgi:NADH:ubiquinone oxidoreductase subunit 2 (subunit N)